MVSVRAVADEGDEGDIWDVDLPGHVYFRLARAGVIHVRTIQAMTDTDLLRLHGIGPVTVRALRAALGPRRRSLMSIVRDSGDPSGPGPAPILIVACRQDGYYLEEKATGRCVAG